MDEYVVQDSDTLLIGSYEYSHGVLNFQDQGSNVPFELNVDGTPIVVEYQLIAEK